MKRGFRLVMVDALHFEHREIPFALFGMSNFAAYRVTRSQIETSHLRGSDIHIVWSRQVVEIR